MEFVNIRKTLSEISENIGLQIIVDENFNKNISDALDKSGKWHKRNCILKAPLVMVIVFLMILFRDRSIKGIRNFLLQQWRAAIEGLSLNAITPEALCHARERLGVEPLRILFENRAAKIKPFSTFAGLTTWAVDGSCFNLPDTHANEAYYGRPANSAYPQMEVVSLVETSTRQVGAVVFTPCDSSEIQGVQALLPRLGKNDVVLMDRGISSGWIFCQCRKNSVHFAARISSTWKPRIIKTLGVGDYIVEITVQIPKESRDDGKKFFKMRLRMIEYQIKNGETIRLLTDLPNPAKYPARQIAELYHSRWECEMAYDELKNHISSTASGAQNLLFRSKNPDGILQEAYALYALYNAIRGIMAEAGKTNGVAPLEISLVDAAYIIRDTMPRYMQAKSDEERSFIFNQMLKDVAESVNTRPRRNRQYDRQVKKRGGKYKTRREGYGEKKIDFSRELRLVS